MFNRMIPFGALTAVLGLLVLGVSAGWSLNDQAAFPEKQVAAIEPPAHKAYTETLPGSQVRFDMVPVPGGTFFMGSPGNEKNRGEDEGPRHPVKIHPFWMGKMEVTWDFSPTETGYRRAWAA